jgi:hypothetical protein
MGKTIYLQGNVVRSGTVPQVPHKTATREVFGVFLHNHEVGITR